MLRFYTRAGVTRVSEYIRDVFGQVECIKDALGMEEFYRYDALGRVTEKTDRDGNLTSYAYRPDGKIESILFGDGRQAEFSYNPLGQISMVKDWLGETKIDRNHQGKPERKIYILHMGMMKRAGFPGNAMWMVIVPSGLTMTWDGPASCLMRIAEGFWTGTDTSMIPGEIIMDLDSGQEEKMVVQKKIIFWI